MTEERKQELARAMLDFAKEQGDTMRDTPLKVLEEIANDISKAVGSYLNVLAPFYIAALEYLAQTIRANISGAGEIADDLKRHLVCYGIVFPSGKSK